jgi:hypothetical protein
MSNSVNINKESLPSGFIPGHGVVGTSPAKISEINYPISKHVVIRADSGNGNIILVGRPADMANAYKLAGGQEVKVYVDETDKVAVQGGAADQAYSWMVN